MQILNRNEMKQVMAGGYACGCYSLYSTYRRECMARYSGANEMKCLRETNDLEKSCHIDCKFLSRT